MANPPFKTTLSIHGLMTKLWQMVGFLIGIHVLLALIHFRLHELPWLLLQIFDVDEEDSLPTWYSAIALFLTSFVLWINARGHRAVASPQRWYWLGLAAGFLLLSADEIAGLHETLNSEIEISWAVPGGIVALLVGLVYLRFLFQLERGIAVQFFIGGAIFVVGAVGVELYTESYAASDQLDTLAYYLWNALEEGMEMAGVLIFLRAVLVSMKAGADAVPVEITLTN